MTDEQEAQAKIAIKIQKHYGLSFPTSDCDRTAKVILRLIYRLGYHKLPDRPELREKIEVILEPTLDRLYHQDLPEGKYEEIAIKASIGMLKSNLTTQILALYPDDKALIEQGRREVGRGESSPKIICLCGSSRFCGEMAVIAWTFEKEGYITLGLHLLPIAYTKVESHLAEAEGVAEKMDELHLRKIDMADVIYVVNKNGYIGESTAREIKYAEGKGKPVKYLEPKLKEWGIK